MKPSIVLTTITVLVLASVPVQAQVASPRANAAAALRLLPDPSTVEPLPLPQVDDEPSLESLPPPAPHARRLGPGSPAQPPDPGAGQRMPGLDDWLDHQSPAQPEPEPDLRPLAATPAAGWRFTTSRVFPKEQLLSYPFSTIGRIIFQDLGGGFHACSGAVIQLRLVLTAGHCVYDPDAGEWYENWVFYPQYYDGSSPLGPWTTLQAFTTRQWVNGGLPNPGDFGILILADQAQPIGRVTGWLGWQTGAFAEHFHQFGYPGSLDDGERPQETSAQVARVLRSHFRWGTNQTFGSSGGPLVMNFGENGFGQNYLSNRVVGVVSFGNPSTGYAASSKIRANFVALFRAACNAQPGNCGTPRVAAAIASR